MRADLQQCHARAGSKGNVGIFVVAVRFVAVGHHGWAADRHRLRAHTVGLRGNGSMQALCCATVHLQFDYFVVMLLQTCLRRQAR